MSTMPQRSKFGDASNHLLVAVPAAKQPTHSRGRLIAATALAVGLVLVVAVAVVALVDRGHGATTPTRPHPAAAPAKVVLPYVVGAGQQLATSTLQGEGFAVRVHTVPSASQAVGMVVGEKPTGGRSVPSGTHVLLTVSSGS